MIKIGVLTYGVIGLYAVLTGLAGMMKWKEEGFKVLSFLFVVVSVGMIVSLF